LAAPLAALRGALEFTQLNRDRSLGSGDNFH
jgi:hypothetical protein